MSAFSFTPASKKCAPFSSSRRETNGPPSPPPANHKCASMNLDDPKLTAYALGALDGPERTAMEERLRGDPAATAEVTALRDFTARLRAELHTENMPGL